MALGAVAFFPWRHSAQSWKNSKPNAEGGRERERESGPDRGLACSPRQFSAYYSLGFACLLHLAYWYPLLRGRNGRGVVLYPGLIFFVCVSVRRRRVGSDRLGSPPACPSAGRIFVDVLFVRLQSIEKEYKEIQISIRHYL